MRVENRQRRFFCEYDKNPDQLTKEVDELSRRSTWISLCPNEYIRYLNVRAAYFVNGDKLKKSRFCRATIDGETVAIRIICKIENYGEFRRIVNRRKRGVYFYAEGETAINCWFCQVIWRTDDGGKKVVESVIAERYLQRIVEVCL